MTPALLEPNVQCGYTTLGFHSATVADKEGRTPGPPTAGAAHERLHREKVIQQSRLFLRNHPLYRGMQRVHRQLVHGSGFTLNVRPNVPEGEQASPELVEWCRAYEADFNAWWSPQVQADGTLPPLPDVRGQRSGPRLGALVCDETFAAGDVGVVLVEPDADTDRLQVIEAEQITDTPGAQGDGITKDKYGAPVEYRVYAYDPKGSGALKRDEVSTYKPAQFLLIGDPDRCSSSRTLPPDQASFPNLHRLNDMADSVAIATQLQARVAMLVNREAGAPTPGQGDKAAPGAPDDSVAPRMQTLPFGLIFHGKPGETVTGMERTAPGRSYREDFNAMARTLGLPVGLPLELLLLDFTPDNYSQTRALIALCQDAFLERQRILEEGFYMPVAAWRLRRQIGRKKLTPAPGPFVVEWIKPSFPWVDLLAETQAWGERVKRGFASYTEAVKSQNRDPDAVRAQQDADVREAIKRAGAIEKETGKAVPWEIFCGLEPPGQTARAELVKQGDPKKTDPPKKAEPEPVPAEQRRAA